MIKIPNYQITENIYAGSRTIVYRAVRIVDQLPVVIKLLKNPYPSFNELVQFRNQYTIAKNINSPLIIKTYSLEPYKNGYALVMEDFGGISLQEWRIKTANKLSLIDFLKVAIMISNALEILYQERIIHKDINPRNILINLPTKTVKLIDFSIASLLPRETETLMNPNVLEGTLAYISPEQTGRMNRGIDYRTDFYSLGVTFYELLAGELPFQSHDLIDLVHCHIAKMPTALKKWKEIPAVISDIVMKLMAKNAEDRYQSASGLKSDLEQCLTQLQQIGKIEYFELGKRDIADRFIIPEKLYGRETEVEILLNAFERVSNPPQTPLSKGKIPPQSPLTKGGNSEIMLVAGFSGIGKTAVINEVHKPIVKQRGYFIKGKYDQFQRNIPFSAFVQAFRDLIGKLLSVSDAELQTWKTKILTVLGENGQVLIDVIPELENIIGKQPPAIELSGTAAQNRFNLLFQKFVQVFTRKEHPLVIFLDDLQWADSASLKLVKLLMQDTEYLLLLGAYRDNEVSPVHPLILTINELLKTDAKVNTITLPSLTEFDLNQLVADTLHCELSLAQPLTKLVYQKTQGNPFFATQFLKVLNDEKLISFNRQIQHWQCDIAQVKSLAITDDVVEFMALQLHKLPTETQEVLKLAACIGANFDLNMLGIVSEKSPQKTATDLWIALQEGLVIPTTKGYKFFTQSDSEEVLKASANPTYRFLHDRVQQAAYTLIPDEEKQSTHLQIGKLLQQNLSEIEKEEKQFDIVGHFNLGIELITEPQEREALAKINLAASQKARNSTAYVAARNFVQTGINLLPTDCWQSQYELTLNLYVSATETAYLNGEFAEMEAMAAMVLESANTILDKVKIYQIQINALTVKTQILEAIAVGRIALSQLGIQLPSEPDESLINTALQTLAKKLEDKQIEELIHLPVMTDPGMSAAMQILAMLFASILQSSPTLLPLLGSTMVRLSLEFGNSPASTIGYVTYGIVLSTFLGQVERGYSFGRVAISLLDRLNVREFRCVTLITFCGFIQHRVEALRATIPTAKEAYLAGMEIGDFLYSGYSIFNYFYNKFFAGVALDDWEAESENYCLVLANVKQDSALAYLRMQQQTAHNLRKILDRPDLLNGTAYDEGLMIPKYHQDNDFNALGTIYTYKLMLAYFFCDYTNTLDYIAEANRASIATAGQFHTPVFHFYAALTYLTFYSTQSEIEQAKTLEEMKTHQTNLAEWADHAPMNHQHKVDLVEAEKYRILGQKTEAIEFYDRAIAGANKNEYLNEEALANELAAKFYLNWGKEKVAAGYMQEAYYCYTRWGAKAKVAHLEQKYPQLLEVILQRPQAASRFLGTISPSIIKSITSTTNTQNSTFWLDFPAVMKAAQAISEEVELEKLLGTLMQVAITNGGAETGFLVIHQQAEWLVVTKANQNQTETLEIPFVECQELPQSLIYSVARNQQTAVFDNLSATPEFAGDRYIISHEPKSVLCTPITKQGKLIAILYLENNLTVGAFTSDRIKTLQFLTSQAAISIENARFYQQVENYSQTLEAEVEQKTETLSQKAFDLEQALTNLQQTQSQLIQSEKMSSLGQIVAGVAHEINNPVNFIYGNIKPASQYVNDLLDLITTYQNTYPQTAEIEAIIEEIDLDFLVGDLQKLLGSMQNGAKRIRDIVRSLRNFSRLDESEIKKSDIHEGIESTLLILQHRFQGFQEEGCGVKYPEIKVIKNYGKLPLFLCYSNQLNQVFLNLFNNAIDALNEVSSNGENSDFTPTITITTATEGRFIQIKISDNGPGISPKIVNKIFDPFFTTKSVGSGTGLGLYVSYQIVVERHGGELICVSNIGRGTEFIMKMPIA
ncbi:MAG: AAA family ATPase [Microcoleaceae cyanobacterium MO_207.B10]|nr:AAA family ATPase [Microcoleaceae cyanobacterium MO_207.B10]